LRFSAGWRIVRLSAAGLVLPPGSEVLLMSGSDFGLGDRVAEASAAAAWLGMGDALFRDVPVGGLFRFKGHADLFRKEARGYRAADGSGPRFKTGALTAVFRAG
jgi:hypothetical protein